MCDIHCKFEKLRLKSSLEQVTQERDFLVQNLGGNHGGSSTKELEEEIARLKEESENYKAIIASKERDEETMADMVSQYEKHVLNIQEQLIEFEKLKTKATNIANTIDRLDKKMCEIQKIHMYDMYRGIE